MNIDALFAQASKLQCEGQVPQSISLYEQILTQDPKHFNTLHFLGLAYAQLEDMDTAIFYLLDALSLNPNNACLLNNLANAYKKSHRLDKAIQYYEQAIKLEPKYAKAHNNLAAVYALQDNYDAALHHYAQAVHAEPAFSAAHFNLGLLFLKNNQLAAAKTQFNNVISLNPLHTEAFFYLGVLHLENNALLEAETAFQEVIEQDSAHLRALSNLGVIAVKRDCPQLAVDYFTKALVLDNENKEARNNLAALFMHHDRYENALMHYDVLLKEEPDNLEYLYNCGVAQMALGHLNEAIIFFDRILELDENHASTLNNLAAVYLKVEERIKAQAYLKRALAINSKDKVSAYMLHAMNGDANATTTPEYAHNLFNNYALYYDHHVQGALHYCLPQHIARVIHQLEWPKNVHTLDLGCGTGLTGAVCREASSHLTGVDIAEKMLAKALEKEIYDNLVASEINLFLQETQEQYDLIVAADVFPYFGALDSLFCAIQQHLKPRGYFIFTCEISEKNSWFLQPSARFSHHPDYIKKQAGQNQFEIIRQEQVMARTQNHQPLYVMLYVLRLGKKT